jgi:hypothetical protein
MDDTLALQLVGSYRLRTELRAEGYPHSADEGDLRLAMNDTLSRYYIRTALRGYLRRGDRVLGGTYSEGARGSDTAFVEGRVLTIGCPYWMCMDASPTVHVIEWIDRDGFGGTWENHQTGIAYVTNAQGVRLPNPSGTFCARRARDNGASPREY